MIRKSGHRFSEKDHAQTKKIERDDESKRSHHALKSAAVCGLPWTEVLDQPQQNLCARAGIGDIDMLVRMVADPAAASHEQHRHVGDVDHRHAVVTGPAWQFKHPMALAL